MYFSALEGGGWTPAVMETTRELDFIGAAQRYFTDNRNYWIGGYTSAEHREFISPRSIDNSGPGNNYVCPNKGTTIADEFYLSLVW